MAVVNAIKYRTDKLVEERRTLLSKRAELAKRSVKLAEMCPAKRGLSETFGKSQEDLERLDLAYTARINTIADEAGIIKSDIDTELTRYAADRDRCGVRPNNVQN